MAISSRALSFRDFPRRWAIGVLVVVGIIGFIVSLIIGWSISSEVLY